MRPRVFLVILGNRLRSHICGPDFVIAEVALVPPLILVSYHAPSNSATPEQFDLSLSHLLDELTDLQSKLPHTARLVVCSDLNTQLIPQAPIIGPWTNPSERPPIYCEQALC